MFIVTNRHSLSNFAAIAVAMALGCGVVAAADLSQHAVAARVIGTAITVADLSAVEPAANGVITPQRDSEQKTLQALIDEQLLVQQAESAKLDRDPQVMTAIQDARRAVLVNEWLKRIIGQVELPSDDSISSYYAAHAGQFSERRTFSLRVAEITGQPEQLQMLQKQCLTAKSLEEVSLIARQSGLSSHESTLEKTSDRLSEDSLHRVVGADAENPLIVNIQGNHLEVVQPTSSRPDPLDPAMARPMISQILISQLAKQRVDAAIATLRAKATIEVVASSATNSPASAAAPRQPTLQEDIAHGLK